jgi:hypothetical protein
MESTMKFLEPYLAKLSRVIRSGWQRWEELGEQAPDSRVLIRSRARGNLVYDFIVASALKEFDGVDAVKIGQDRGFLEINIEGVYLIRFKKLNQRGMCGGASTGQKKLWLDNQKSLPGMPPEIVRLIAGYQLDVFATGIEAILLTRPERNSIKWKTSISDTGDISDVIVIRTAEPKPAFPRSSLVDTTQKDKKE